METELHGTEFTQQPPETTIIHDLGIQDISLYPVYNGFTKVSQTHPKGSTKEHTCLPHKETTAEKDSIVPESPDVSSISKGNGLDETSVTQDEVPEEHEHEGTPVQWNVELEPSNTTTQEDFSYDLFLESHVQPSEKQYEDVSCKESNSLVVEKLGIEEEKISQDSSSTPHPLEFKGPLIAEVWPPIGVSISPPPYFLNDGYTNGTSVDFATLARTTAVLTAKPADSEDCDVPDIEKEAQSIDGTTLRPILKGTQDASTGGNSQMMRTVRFGSPVVHIRFINEDEEVESTTSTELLFSDEEVDDVDYKEIIDEEMPLNDDQEVPKADDEQEPAQKRQKIDMWPCEPPEFNFPPAVSVPALDIRSYTQLRNSGLDPDHERDDPDAVSSFVGSAKKDHSIHCEEYINDGINSQYAEKAAAVLAGETNELASQDQYIQDQLERNYFDDKEPSQADEITTSKENCINPDELRAYAENTESGQHDEDSAIDEKGDARVHLHSHKTSLDDVFEEEVENAINQLEDKFDEPQTVYGARVGIRRRIADAREAGLCHSAFRLGEDAFIEEVDDDVCVPRLEGKEFLLTHIKLRSEIPDCLKQDDTFTEDGKAAVTHLQSKLECIQLSPVRRSDIRVDHPTENFEDDDLDRISNSSQISDITNGIALSVYLGDKRDEESVRPSETAKKKDEMLQEMKPFHEKRTCGMLSNIKSSLEDLDGPELLQMAMYLVEGALKKTKDPIVMKQQSPSSETKSAPICNAFMWKNKFPYDSQRAEQNVEFSGELQQLENDRPDETGENDETHSLPKMMPARQLRLGLSRRSRVRSLHPYAEGKHHRVHKHFDGTGRYI